MYKSLNTTFCRLRGRVCVKRGRGSGEGAGRIWARERLPRSLDFLDRSIRKISGSNGTSEKIFLFFRTEYPNGNWYRVQATLWIPDSVYWIPDSSSVDSGFQKGLDSKFFSVLMLFFAFRFRFRFRFTKEHLPPFFPFSLSPTPFDACYAGYLGRDKHIYSVKVWQSKRVLQKIKLDFKLTKVVSRSARP